MPPFHSMMQSVWCELSQVWFWLGRITCVTFSCSRIEEVLQIFKIMQNQGDTIVLLLRRLPFPTCFFGIISGKELVICWKGNFSQKWKFACGRIHHQVEILCISKVLFSFLAHKLSLLRIDVIFLSVTWGTFWPRSGQPVEQRTFVNLSLFAFADISAGGNSLKLFLFLF